MAVEIEIPEKKYEMRPLVSSPVVRAFRLATNLSLKLLFLGGVLYLAIPSSGPDTPVRTIPDYTRIGGIATLVSGPPEASIDFNQYVSWVSPPRFNWDYFAGMDDFAGPAATPDEQSTDEEQSISSQPAPAPEATTVAFFVPDSFGGSGLDLTVPDGSFVLSARPFFPTPEPRSAILFLTGLAGFGFAALYRRRRRLGAR